MNVAAAVISLAAVAILAILATTATDQAPPDPGRSPIASGAGVGVAASASVQPRASAPAPANTDPAPRATPVRGAASAAGTAVASASASAAIGRVLGRPPAVETIATRIQLPRLAIDLPIVEGDGIDAPLHKAAHYPGTAWPGGGSNIYIYGHAQEGMFLALWESRVGDEIVLTLTDGTSVTYRIVRVMPRVPWDAIQFLDPTPHEQLTVQTSTSNTATAPRFVVIARPAQ